MKTREVYYRTRPRDAAFFYVGSLLAIFSLAMLFAGLHMTAGAFQANTPEGRVMPHGFALLQDEGEKPTLCMTRSHIVTKIVHDFPKATIERHRLENGTMWLFVNYGDMSGALYSLTDQGLVCERYGLGQFKLMVFLGISGDETNDIEVLPVWPES